MLSKAMPSCLMKAWNFIDKSGFVRPSAIMLAVDTYLSLIFLAPTSSLM